METSKIIFVAVTLVIGGGCLFGIFKQMKDGFGEYNTKVYGITIVSIMVVTLALSDIDAARLAPAYGILGAIAGYLFGFKKS